MKTLAPSSWTVHADADDLTKVMTLLREYTGKLQKICLERELRRFRRFQLLAFNTFLLLSLAVACGFAIGDSSLVSRESDRGLFVPVASLLFGAVTASMVFAVCGDYAYRFQDAFGTDSVASTLERLVSLSSQYSEHSSRRLSDKFEFDLRIAEAESALRIYRFTSRHDHYSIFGSFHRLMRSSRCR